TRGEYAPLPRHPRADNSVGAVPLPHALTRLEQSLSFAVIDPEKLEVIDGEDTMVLLRDLRGTNPSVHGDAFHSAPVTLIRGPLPARFWRQKLRYTPPFLTPKDGGAYKPRAWAMR